MDDFLTKPIQPANLWAAMSRVPRPATGRSSGLAISAGALLAACTGDAGVLDRLREALHSRLGEDLGLIDRALIEGDCTRIREGAHSLSGMLSVFSAQAGELAAELEELAARDALQEAGFVAQRLRDLAPHLVQAVDNVSIESLRRDASA
jgi:HPt (histidine-containing phosphotransfer) domain-containing protein